ncbi:MAG: general secretion pathway protein GspB [Polaromonas sp.]|uniref:general secretion pathway protein GspB n=1 Tax=Polaromonas sp. TaxID=1869339 RepID=UPI0027311C9B|nr:general secretion pathway protein GspB [Polaromonas sp.]MDP2254907.1 general secretion pathway protein GspB [Polaromonas sp.]
MSLILDALKRADSERAHGRVPGLHTQAIPPGKPAPALRQSVRPYLLLSGVALALLCLALWNWPRPSTPAAKSPDTPPPIATMSPPAPSAAAPAIAPAPVAAAAPPAMQASAPPSAAATTVNRNTTSTSTSNNNAQVTMKAPVLAKVPAKPAAPAERQREQQAQPLVAAPTAPPANPSPALSELPENIRQALPKLAISGSIYSETAAHRMLIINGQVFHEGEKPAPGLELEQIKPKTAIFNFKGQRYSMGY